MALTRRDVLKAAGLALAGGAFAGCDDELALPQTAGTFVTIGSVHIVGDGMYDAFKRWLESLTRSSDTSFLA